MVEMFAGMMIMLIIQHFVRKRLLRMPNAVKNMLVIGGGFCLLSLQIGIVALMIGDLATERSHDPGMYIFPCVAGALLMVWNAFLSLNIAQRLMLMGLYKGMREQQWQAGPKPFFETNPRVSWKDYRG